jgi:sn-glycerol 3-phosphate transport system permease protein
VTGIAAFVPTGTQLPEWNLVMAAAVMALLPPIAVVVAMQRWFVKGLTEPEK